jgi:hypothetical protein
MASSGSPIALASDFQSYETWESVVLPAVDGGTAHSSEARTVFIKQRPPAGSTEFPVGTLIVKQMQFNTLAMGKRGGSYNANGAKGWEWFDLERHSSGAVVIAWRGLGPPLGEAYGKSSATCNDCHGSNGENDSVLTPELRLR